MDEASDSSPCSVSAEHYPVARSENEDCHAGNDSATQLTDSALDSPPRSKIKYSRENTAEEKRRMRRERVKRKRKGKMKERLSLLKTNLHKESQLRRCAEQDTNRYKNMARTFWDRWRWELHKRREVMIDSLRARSLVHCSSRGVVGGSSSIQEIDPSMLTNPVFEKEEREHFVGRGSFGVVKVQIFRGIQVAVKEFLPRTLEADVIHEASILCTLCHPYLPLFLGVCTKHKPLRLVMQFHAFEGLHASTMENELSKRHFDGCAWILLCAQLLEAIVYLHEETNILHNDIKANNVLVAQSIATSVPEGYQVVLIDFGKATKVTESKRYHLSDFEKREYTRKYPHISPEVIEGETKQSVYSDMFSFGRLVYRVIDFRCTSDLPPVKQSTLSHIADQCVSVRYHSRPHGKKALQLFESLLED